MKASQVRDAGSVVVECGAHGCGGQQSYASTAAAKKDGWHFDKDGGYGWICPECNDPEEYECNSCFANSHDDKQLARCAGRVCPFCAEGVVQLVESVDD